MYRSFILFFSIALREADKEKNKLQLQVDKKSTKIRILTQEKLSNTENCTETVDSLYKKISELEITTRSAYIVTGALFCCTIVGFLLLAFLRRSSTKLPDCIRRTSRENCNITNVSVDGQETDVGRNDKSAENQVMIPTVDYFTSI